MKHLNSCNQMTSLKLVDRKEKFFYFKKAIKINTLVQLTQFIEQPPKPGLRHPYETLSKHNLSAGLQFKDLLSSMFTLPKPGAEDDDEEEDDELFGKGKR